jgi:hypothetical protein
LSTPFLKVYKRNEILKNDTRLKYKTSNQLYSLYYEYLQFSISKFFRYSYTNLNDITEFVQEEYEFVVSNTDDLEFLLENPNTPPIDCTFYVGFRNSNSNNYTEITEYSYNSTSHVLTISDNRLSVGDTVYVSGYIIGQFNQTLNNDEITILSEGFLIPYLEEQQNRNSLLTQLITGGSSKLSGTQGNHMSAVHTIVQDKINEVDRLIVKYTYRASPNNLKDLGAK